MFKTKLQKIIEEPLSILYGLYNLAPVPFYHLLSVKRINNSISTFIDVGANKGKYVDACKIVFPDAQIIAFEPIVELSNILKNKGATVYQNVLWNKNQKDMIFYYDKKKKSDSSLFKYGESDRLKKDGRAVEERKIKALRFDSLKLPIRRPCLMKLDVEGAEVQAIEDFGKRLREIDVLLVEIHFQDNHVGRKKLSELISVLELYGFNGFLQKTVRYQNKIPGKCDLLFFRTT